MGRHQGKKKGGHLKWRKRVLPPFSCSFKCFLNQVVFNRPKFLLCTIRNTETEACDNIVNLVYVRFFFFFSSWNFLWEKSKSSYSATFAGWTELFKSQGRRYGFFFFIWVAWIDLFILFIGTRSLNVFNCFSSPPPSLFIFNSETSSLFSPTYDECLVFVH